MRADGQFGMVRARPDIEQVVTRYERLQADVLLRLSAEIDGLHWQRGGDGRRADCASCRGHGGPGRRSSLRRWAARTAIPDPYGGTLLLGTGVRTVLGVDTGCHPPP